MILVSDDELLSDELEEMDDLSEDDLAALLLQTLEKLE